ncbi:MAG: hypothetical protein RL074_653, partial [Bacteroidota bacterium]
KNGDALQKLKNSLGRTSLGFDKNMNFEEYIQYKIAIQQLNLQNVSEAEFIY